jgi:hypothetical protein
MELLALVAPGNSGPYSKLVGVERERDRENNFSCLTWSAPNIHKIFISPLVRLDPIIFDFAACIRCVARLPKRGSPADGRVVALLVVQETSQGRRGELRHQPALDIRALSIFILVAAPLGFFILHSLVSLWLVFLRSLRGFFAYLLVAAVILTARLLHHVLSLCCCALTPTSTGVYLAQTTSFLAF